LTLYGAVLGYFIGGLVAVSFSKSDNLKFSYLIGIGLLLFPGIFIIVVTPASAWFNVLNLLF